LVALIENMPLAKMLSIDFYRVEMPEGAMTFEELLGSVFLTPAPQRNSLVRERTLRLQRLSPWANCIEGELIRIRMDDMPQIADLDGTITDMDLPASRGVGECAAFLYAPETRALVMQRSFHGASASALAGYFDNFSGQQDCIVLEPIIREGDYTKLRSMANPRKFEVKIAHVEDPSIREGSTTDYSRLGRRYAGDSMDITVSAGRARTAGLNPSAVMDDIRHFFRINQAADNTLITKLRVTGRGAGDEVLALDLLKSNLKHRVEINIGDERTIAYEVRRDAVRSVFDKERSSLMRMFGA
jgi:hypothetical protein